MTITFTYQKYGMRLEDLYLTEAGYAPFKKFHYKSHSRLTGPAAAFHGHRRPEVLVLGTWRHGKTGNSLMGGINIGYLGTSERELLKKYYRQIFGNDLDLYDRCQLFKQRFSGVKDMNPADGSKLRDIFYKAYRTYREPLMRGT